MKPTKLIRSITHIRLRDAHRSKLDQLDQLAAVYLPLCQRYVHLFCRSGTADAFLDPLFDTPLSARWQRVAIQQAAGMAQSWLTNRANHHADYLQRQAAFERYRADHPDSTRKPPTWHEPRLPTLRNVCIQANVNVVTAKAEIDEPVMRLEAAQATRFDFWLQIATLTPRQPLYLPVSLSAYHREALAAATPNTSTTLNRRKDGSWWLTLSITERVEQKPAPPDMPVLGVDVGIASFLTTSDGKHYGSFHGKLARRHRLDRAKRQRKAKLRACLEKQGVDKLPSVSSAAGQRLGRHVRQSINRAVNECFRDHPSHLVSIEDLSVSGMRFKARVMNAYLYASNLGHIPEQLKWRAAQRRQPLQVVNAAYSSQECNRCHHVSRGNRPTQQTFCCEVCGHKAQADENASVNLARRAHDEELRRCRRLDEVKALLVSRHEGWQRDGCP